MPEHVLKMVDDIGNGPDDPATQRMLILIYEAHMTDGKQVIFSLPRRSDRSAFNRAWKQLMEEDDAP